MLKVTGQDGQALLEHIAQAEDRTWLKEIPAVKLLKQVWQQPYLVEAGQIRHRDLKEMLPARELIIHDSALAQAYYVEWQRMWSALGSDRLCVQYQTFLPAVVKSDGSQR